MYLEAIQQQKLIDLGDPREKGVWKVMKGLVINIPSRGNTMANESVARRCKDWQKTVFKVRRKIRLMQGEDGDGGRGQIMQDIPNHDKDLAFS